jgi:hypothetical protein
MRLIHTAKFERDYAAAPTDVQRAFDKQQQRFLADNLQHALLHAKKYDESTGLWQARVNRSWRFCSPSRVTLRSAHDHGTSKITQKERSERGSSDD